MPVQFELVTPEQLLVSRDVDMVVVPGTEGNFGVLPGHAQAVGVGARGQRATQKGEEKSTRHPTEPPTHSKKNHAAIGAHYTERDERSNGDVTSLTRQSGCASRCGLVFRAMVGVAQLVEQWIVDPRVAGSNPVAHPKNPSAS